MLTPGVPGAPSVPLVPLVPAVPACAMIAQFEFGVGDMVTVAAPPLGDSVRLKVPVNTWPVAEISDAPPKEGGAEPPPLREIPMYPFENNSNAHPHPRSEIVTGLPFSKAGMLLK